MTCLRLYLLPCKRLNIYIWLLTSMWLWNRFPGFNPVCHLYGMSSSGIEACFQQGSSAISSLASASFRLCLLPCKLLPMIPTFLLPISWAWGSLAYMVSLLSVFLLVVFSVSSLGLPSTSVLRQPLNDPYRLLLWKFTLPF